MKKTKILVMTLLIAISGTFPALAGEWKKEKDGRWWYQNDDGSYPANQWQEIDGKEYYFGTEGYMMRNMFAPDDREVGPDGVWTGFVQSYEEREQAFLDIYKPYLESLLFLAQSSNHIGVMTEMESDTDKDLLSAIPRLYRHDQHHIQLRKQRQDIRQIRLRLYRNRRPFSQT